MYHTRQCLKTGTYLHNNYLSFTSSYYYYCIIFIIHPHTVSSPFFLLVPTTSSWYLVPGARIILIPAYGTVRYGTNILSLSFSSSSSHFVFNLIKLHHHSYFVESSMTQNYHNIEMCVCACMSYFISLVSIISVPSQTMLCGV